LIALFRSVLGLALLLYPTTLGMAVKPAPITFDREENHYQKTDKYKRKYRGNISVGKILIYQRNN